ncbi:restriction endonuclease subunit S [Lactiplantibacillus plantarum subsp. plantarum]|uniref:restriction endonuclease subunit S n=1 Tax=Lactiplantibacillus plantarum TaxID=1590 RepID=UPI001BDF3E37|nr:restriction endonuclease subunit S [Lactiplantibacillus plantarum]UOF05593.1 restriction endonuclease subunit S [Lactiplantibacillus plantarum subsp. plantarum]
MKNENLVPKVRFKGFSDPWEQRKLKLLADFSKGAGYSKKDIIDQGTPIVLYGRLYTNYQVNITTIKDTFVKVRPGSVFSECNDVIVPASGETAEDIARASHVCISGAVLGGDLNIIKPKINIIDSSFLALCISNGQQNKELIKRAQGKSIVHLHNSDLKQVVLKYPSKRNQSMIARVFDKTDNLIAANEDKLEQLKTLKKLMMQKIFSQEWRFKGFTDPWEQRKLCQIATINPKSVISPHFLYVDLESVSQNRVTQYKAVTKDDAPSRAQRLAKKGDIFFQNVRPYQKNNLLFLTNKNNVVFSTGYTQIRTKQDIRYLFYALQTTPFVNRILALSTGTSYPAISSSKLANASLLVPIIDEQSKVGLSIFKIDSLIAANEDKLNQLKKLKKYLMQNMFV